MVYFMIPDAVLGHFVYHNVIVSIAAYTIDLFAPAEHVSALQNKLLSTHVSLEIVRGCDGAGTIFMLIAAVIAFRASVKHKFIGVSLGLFLLYILNESRIISLYFILAYKRGWFQLVHTYFAPTLIIIISCLFFLWWAILSMSPTSKYAQEHLS